MHMCEVWKSFVIYMWHFRKVSQFKKYKKKLVSLYVEKNAVFFDFFFDFFFIVMVLFISAVYA